MIGVAFLNEMVFMAIGVLVGWIIGRRFEQFRQWMIRKGYTTNVFKRG